MPPETNPDLGQPVSDVPTLESDESCNGKRSSGNGEFEGYCDNPAGEGTDHEGSGRCAECGGTSAGPTTEAGKLVSSMNAQSHGLTADPFHYHEGLDSPEEKRFVLKVANSIEERIHENTGSCDFLDEVLARQMAVQFHIVAQASDHFNEEGLIERIFTDDGQIEVENRMLDHIRQYSKDLVANLEKIGATKGTERELDALAVWRSELS